MWSFLREVLSAFLWSWPENGITSQQSFTSPTSHRDLRTSSLCHQPQRSAAISRKLWKIFRLTKRFSQVLQSARSFWPATGKLAKKFCHFTSDKPSSLWLAEVLGLLRSIRLCGIFFRNFWKVFRSSISVEKGNLTSLWLTSRLRPVEYIQKELKDLIWHCPTS